MDDNNKNGNRPLDPYEEQYRRQLEQFSRMAGSDSGGEVDLRMGSIDDAFAGEYQDNYNSQYPNGPQQGGYRQPARSGQRSQNSGRYDQQNGRRYNSQNSGRYDQQSGRSYNSQNGGRYNPQSDGYHEPRNSGYYELRNSGRYDQQSGGYYEPRNSGYYDGPQDDGYYSPYDDQPAPRRRPDRQGQRTGSRTGGDNTGVPAQKPRTQQPPKSKKKKSAKPQQKQRRYSSEELQFGSHAKGKKLAHEKRHPVRSVFTTIFVVLLAAFVGLNGMLYYYTGLVHQRPRGERLCTNGSLKSSKVTNILMIGSDTRDENEYGRTDSMILLSINSEKKTVTMTSFMRDMYVEIKGRNHSGEDVDFWDKLNSAYVYGGAELLMDTLEYNFDVSVDNYVYVDFFAFIDIVDSLGGIEVDVTDEEAAGMEDPMREQNYYLGQAGSTDLLTNGGRLTLNGNQALAYARLRYVGNADFQRTERQREVIGKMINKAKSSDPLTMNKFAKAVCSNLSSNMSRANMMLSAYKAVFSLNYEMKSLRLPAEGAYGYGYHGDQSTLDVDLDACRELLRSEIYG